MSKWKKTPLGSIGEAFIGLTYKPEDISSNGIIVLRSGNIQHNEIDLHEIIRVNKDIKNKLIIRNNDILICSRNGSSNLVGKSALITDILEQMTFGAFMMVYRSHYNKYLHHFMQSPYFKRQLNRSATTTINQITKSMLDKIVVSLPPLEEQHKIASILDTVSKTLKLRKQQLNELDLLVKSKFEEMFGNPVVNPKGFLCYTVDDVIEFQGGSQPDKKYFEYEKTEDNIRLIQIRDYKSNRYLTYIPKIMAKRFCTVDDIMIGRYGPPIFQILQGIEGSFNVALMKAIPRIGNKEFIRYFLKQDCLLKYLEGLSKRTAGQDGIQMDKLKLYPFPYPPIELQNKFASFVQTVDKLKSEVQKSIDQLQTLFDSLMQQYFE